jgi:hypothetical protein
MLLPSNNPFLDPVSATTILPSKAGGVALPPFMVEVISKLFLVQITTTLIFSVSSVINLAILRLAALRDLTISFFLNLFDQILKPTLPPTNTFNTHWSKNSMPTLELHTI